jgi:uncharacterized protein (TIGR03000 family)
MKRSSSNGWHWLFLLSLSLLAQMPSPLCADEEKKPVHLDILVPEDAQLEVNGHKTKSTGHTRRFESPPVAMGRDYAYALKVTWQGHTLTRRIQIRPESPVKLDLRQELRALAAPSPAGSFFLLVPPALMVRADDKVVFPLRVKRFDFPDPISIRFDRLPKGISAPDMKLSEGQSDSNAILFASADAPQGIHEIRIAAASGTRKDTSTIKITVARPETTNEIKAENKAATPPVSKLETKSEPESGPTIERPTEAKPEAKQEMKTSPALRLVSPDRIALCPGQSKYVEIEATTQSGGPLPAEPTVTFVSSPESKLRSTVWTVSNFKNNPCVYKVGFVVKAASDAPAGEQKVRVLAATDKLRSEHILHFVVSPAVRKPNPPARPAPVLELVMPANVEVAVGKAKYLEVQLKTEDGSPLPGEPQVTLEMSPESRLRSSPWAYTYKAGQSTCTIGLAIKAEADGPLGDHEARLRALVGNEKVERTLKVTISPVSELPSKP